MPTRSDDLPDMITVKAAIGPTGEILHRSALFAVKFIELGMYTCEYHDPLGRIHLMHVPKERVDSEYFFSEPEPISKLEPDPVHTFTPSEFVRGIGVAVKPK